MRNRFSIRPYRSQPRAFLCAQANNESSPQALATAATVQCQSDEKRGSLRKFTARLQTNFGRSFLLMLLALLGCGETGRVRVSDNELLGTYVASFGTGKEQLILRSDRTYEQIFSSPTKNFTNHGTWETKYVVLEGTDVGLIHANCSEASALTSPDCYRNLNVHREGGRLKLALNEAADWYYQRED
jgi:hypothetical protein